jgi:hypothetical protein
LIFKGETAVTGTVHGTAVMQLRTVVLDRFANTPDGRACTINTLAHEWTHTVTVNDTVIYTDSGHNSVDVPLVSYTVGSLAQCVYLKRQRPQLDVRACVDEVGTHDFCHRTCEAGWVDAFIAGDRRCKRAH